MKYKVSVPEIWYVEVSVEAENPEEARENARKAMWGINADFDNMEYSHTLESDHYKVQEVH